MSGSKPLRAGMISLGCSKNQVDAERLCALLRQGGFEISTDLSRCDAVIVNTCGFIEDAKRESIDQILNLIPYKQAGTLRAIAVTGCLAERYRDEVMQEIPEADLILGIGKNADIAGALRQALDGKKVTLFGEKQDLPLSGERMLEPDAYSTYLKVADGCDNRCSYCAIPLIRGGFRSRPMEDILDEARNLAKSGVTELNLIAQDTTRYGLDLYGSVKLTELLDRLCEISEIHWLRLLYCYPDRVDDRLLQTMARQDKILPYLDIPVQHASGRILKAMNRTGDAKTLTALFNSIRAVLPDVTLRTTLITGFPGETEEDFAVLEDFVRTVRFDRLGCFAWSREEDTPAFDLPDQIDEDVRRRRADHIMLLQHGIACEIAQAQVGKTLNVLCEGFDHESGLWFGRSQMDAPEVDPKVVFSSNQTHRAGEYISVEITATMDIDLTGRAKIDRS